MFTVAVAGALFTPRLSVTTRENVTFPEVFGTVTDTFEFGAVVVALGLEGVSSTIAGPVALTPVPFAT
jgi:hypothetical protein